jgi:hypothetical protein
VRTVTVNAAIKTNDGVAVIARGDTLSVVYASPARLHRTRWLFDAVDRLALENAEGILCFMLILPTADIPDAATRAENTLRLRKLGPGLRKLVTVPVGDMLRIRLVRTIMRGLGILHGNARSHSVATTVDDGLRQLLEAASPKTPAVSQLQEDLRAMCRELGVQAPPIGSSGKAAPRSTLK